mmetsp:Transcript_8834/g.33364  ORF Transcript_8834/g.33364 Transcript_8834/m.33364 type:complete len:341 (-) Transcript_8834:343-1365(-)
MRPDSRMDLVWIMRIWKRPARSGSPISTCSSRRPGRSKASSMRSFRLVIPMTRMLFRLSTPSSLLSSWFTMLSPTPVPSLVLPRCLQMASISSKMMMCSSLSSPFSRCSSSAGPNFSRMASSDAPTYLFRISGPLMICGSRALSTWPIFRAIRVLPQPGGPKRSMPRMCLMPSCLITLALKQRGAKARRKIRLNSAPRPPIPSLPKSKLVSNSVLCSDLPEMATDSPVSHTTFDLASSCAKLLLTTCACPLVSSPRSSTPKSRTVTLSTAPAALSGNCAPTKTICPAKTLPNWSVSSWPDSGRALAPFLVFPSLSATRVTLVASCVCWILDTSTGLSTIH